MSIKLRKADIIETTGVSNLFELTDLEILFLTCHEIDAFEECINLKRLTMINNGLIKISNLVPIRNTLISLCLCNQNIQIMENLDLPYLKELYLYQNQIEEINGLIGCPRLKRLWLNQNHIKHIYNISNVPELEELHLQSNHIHSLHGIELNINLISLHLAGNPLDDFTELSYLFPLKELTELSLQDIHYGRCPLVDDPNYRNYIYCYMKQVILLDGITVSNSKIETAEDNFLTQMRELENAISSIEEEYRLDLLRVDSQLKGRENHAEVLEKEMITALKELQDLVTDGRSTTNKQVNRMEAIMDNNYKALMKRLEKSTKKALNGIEELKRLAMTEHDSTLALSHFAEMIIQSECELVSILSFIQNEISQSYPQSYPYPSTSYNLTFHNINSSSPDFMMIQEMISIRKNDEDHAMNHHIISNKILFYKLNLVKLYQLHIFSKRGITMSKRMNIPNEDCRVMNHQQSLRLFTLISIDQLQQILKSYCYDSKDNLGWKSCGNNILISNDPGVLAYLYSPVMGTSFHATKSNEDISKKFDDVYDTMPHGNDRRQLLSSHNSDPGNYSDHNDVMLPSLKGALGHTTLLLLSFYVSADQTDLSSIYLPSSTQGLQQMIIPENEQIRQVFMNELISKSNDTMISYVTEYECLKPSFINIYEEMNEKEKTPSKTPKKSKQSIKDSSNNMSIRNKITLMSSDHMNQLTCNQQLQLEFCCICMYSNQYGGDASMNASNTNDPNHQRIKDDMTEGMLIAEEADINKITTRLDQLLLPIHDGLRTSNLLQEFEAETANHVKAFLDQVLEEVNDEEAIALQNTEDEIVHRERNLRILKEDIDNERKNQDNIIRDLRKMTSGNETNSGPKNAGGGHNTKISRKSSF